jgi:hypothetical protein
VQRGAAASGPFLCHGRAGEGERDALFMRSKLGEFDALVLGLFLINHFKGSLSFPTSVSMGVSGEVDINFLISGDQYVAPGDFSRGGSGSGRGLLLGHGGLGQMAHCVRESATPEWFRGFSSFLTPSRSASLIMSIA